MTGRPTLRDLFDGSPTPHIAHLPRTHQRHFYVATDGSYRPNGDGLGTVIETHDGERVTRIALPDVPPSNDVLEYRALHLGLDILAHRTPPDARIDVLIDHDDLAANVNNTILTGDHPDWQSPRRIIIPTSSKCHWRGIQARITGFGEFRAVQIDSRESPMHPLVNTPNKYRHVDRRANRCVLPNPPEFEADSRTDVSYPPPSQFEGRASD